MLELQEYYKRQFKSKTTKETRVKRTKREQLKVNYKAR